jgi:arginyl-tRNA synthetase
MIIESLRKSLTAKAPQLKGELPISPAPPHVKDADISLPWAMAAAKQLRKPPLEVAKELAAAFSLLPEIESAVAAPPGFVNIRLKAGALAANVKAVTLAPGAYGRDASGTPRKVLIEFVSANPTGPLHMASGRGATLGDCLARIMKRLGRTVHSEYYVNDGGARAQLLGESIKARHEGKEPPEKGYHGEYLKDVAAAAPDEIKKSGDALKWGKFAMGYLLDTHKKDMVDFDVAFDRWYLESELFASGKVQQTLEFLKSRNMAYEKDGAVFFASTQEGDDDKDRVLMKSDGTAAYFLPDIAYHKDKYDRGHDYLVDILGADHHGYVPRMKAAIAALGRPPESFHAIVHQLIHLFRGTEAVKMSKRAGTFISLREILDEVGRDACRFFFALRTPDSHLNFDLELAKKQSSENPVFYVQYVHARICSIFRQVPPEWSAALPGPNGRFLDTPEERALMLKLAWFPEVLKDCEKVLSPHPLANYLMELAGLFHAFYEKRKVNDPAEPELSRQRLLLIAGVRDVIKEGLGLLGVSAPEQM